MSSPRATIKAVIAYAEQLRDRADHVLNPDSRAYDPYAKPYYPTTHTARKAYHDALAAIQRRDHERLEQDPDTPIDADDQRHEAAEQALATLAGRARARERDQGEQDQIAERSVKRLARQRRRAELDREARLNGLTVGQRIDRALAALSTIAAASAAQIGNDTARDTEGSPMPPTVGDPQGEAAYIARKAVREIEEKLDQARARDVGKAADAA